MSRAIEAVINAGKQTVRQPDQPGPTPLRTFLGNLQETSSTIGIPLGEEVRESIAFALLNKDAPISQRRASLNTAINTSREKVLQRLLPAVGINGTAIAERAKNVSSRLATGVVEAAAVYPQKPEKGDVMKEILGVLNPNQPTVEDRAVSACVVSDLFRPYLVDRMLELDIYNPDKLREQTNAIQRDARLITNFYQSTKHAIELSVNGKSSIPVEELTERLFQIGPIFAKFAQNLDFPKLIVEKIPQQERAKVATQLAKGMQEGIAPPDDLQQYDLALNLPDGLNYKRHISSASIAHVLETETAEGEQRATKVKRPGINQSITDNEDVFNLITKVSARFVEEHVGGTELGNKVQRTNRVLPFLLGTFVTDLRKELNFPDEVSAQKQGKVIFERHAGIHVPEIDDRYTDDEHITMEHIAGTRLEDLPAHPAHLKNLFVLALESWRSRFLHGDMHGGNIKGLGNGELVAYDWGKTVKLTPDFVKNMGKFMYAVVRKKPDAIAKAHVKIQSPEFTQVNEDEARVIAKEVVDSLDSEKRIRGVIPQTIKGLVVRMGMRHQNIMDSRYSIALQTAVRYGMVVAKELEKPEYQENKKYRKRVLRQSIVGAIKEVYFSKKDKKTE